MKENRQSMDNHLLRVRGLEVYSGEKRLVGPLDFDLQRNSCVALVGCSGSGKTLSSRALLSLNDSLGCKDTFQTFEWFGEKSPSLDLTLFNQEDWQKFRGKSISYIFQDSYLSLSPSRTLAKVFEDVAKSQGQSLAQEEVFKLLADLDLKEPDRLLASYPFQLSGGQLQRMMLALSLLSDAQLIIADEPTSSLDPMLRKEAIELMVRHTRERGKTLLLLSHDLKMMASYADHFIVMSEGGIIGEGSYESLTKSRIPEVEKLLEASVYSHHFDFLENQAATSFLLEWKGAEVSYLQRSGLFRNKRHTVLDNFSFSIKSGEALGIVGPSGSGKSTLGKALAGLLNFTAEQSLFEGKPLSALHRNNRIQILFQNPSSSLNPKRTLRQHLDEAVKLIHRDWTASRILERCERLMETVQLEKGYLEAYPVTLSGGQAQRLALARALAMEPVLMICDEGLASLDVVLQKELLALLRRLKEEQDLSILFISHKLSLVSRLCERVMVLDGGMLIEQGTCRAVFENPKEQTTKLMVEAELIY